MSARPRLMPASGKSLSLSGAACMGLEDKVSGCGFQTVFKHFLTLRLNLAVCASGGSNCHVSVVFFFFLSLLLNYFNYALISLWTHFIHLPSTVALELQGRKDLVLFVIIFLYFNHQLTLGSQ